MAAKKSRYLVSAQQRRARARQRAEKRRRLLQAQAERQRLRSLSTRQLQAEVRRRMSQKLSAATRRTPSTRSVRDAANIALQIANLSPPELQAIMSGVRLVKEARGAAPLRKRRTVVRQMEW